MSVGFRRSFPVKDPVIEPKRSGAFPDSRICLKGRSFPARGKNTDEQCDLSPSRQWKGSYTPVLDCAWKDISLKKKPH